MLRVIERRRLQILVLAACLSALFTAASPGGIPGQRPAEEPADVTFRNGRVYTVDAKRTQAQALAVRGDTIVFVGSDAASSAFTGANTKVVDLKGRMVLPGFVDGHNHVYLRAEALYWVTFRRGATLDAYREATRQFLAQHPDARQIRGVGFNVKLVRSMALSTGRPPKLLLDDIVGRDIPAVFVSNGHHQIWANSKAIQNAGVTRDTPDPLGAIIERDPETGEPTGIFREFGAQNLVIGALPQPDFTVQEYREAILSFQQALAGQRGVTSVLVPVHYPTENFLKAMQALDDDRRLTLRYDLALWANETRGTTQIAEFKEARDKYKGERFTIDSIKIFGTGDAGALVWTQSVLNETVAALDKERFRIYVHVIGNAAANEAILDAFEFARKANGPRDSRHAITHVNDGAAPAAARFKALGVRADGHPVPRAFFDVGAESSSSSDYPVRDFLPFVRLAAGVRNGVPLEAMIASHTIKGAELMFADRDTGSLEVGKSADLVVLDRNLFETPAAEIDQVKVLLTLFAGKEVFRDPSLD